MAKKEYPPQDLLAEKIRTPNDVVKAPDPVKDMVNQLYAIAKEILPEAKKAVPRDPVEFLKQALENKDTYKDVWCQTSD